MMGQAGFGHRAADLAPAVHRDDPVGKLGQLRQHGGDSLKHRSRRIVGQLVIGPYPADPVGLLLGEAELTEVQVAPVGVLPVDPVVDLRRTKRGDLVGRAARDLAQDQAHHVVVPSPSIG
jgi:hypothetical protein